MAAADGGLTDDIGGLPNRKSGLEAPGDSRGGLAGGTGTEANPVGLRSLLGGGVVDGSDSGGGGGGAKGELNGRMGRGL